MFKSDRRGSFGGEVLMYIHEDLPAIACQEMIDLVIYVSLWYAVKPNDKDKLLVGIVYRTQKSNEQNKIVDAVKHIHEMRGFIHILLMGDYNFTEIKWNEHRMSRNEET